MIEKIFTGGIPFLKKLLMKQAMKKSAPFQHEGIMSINKNLVRDVDNKVKKWVESAKSKGQDIDKMSAQELKYLIELNKPKGPTINEWNYQIDSPEGRRFMESIKGTPEGRVLLKSLIKPKAIKPKAQVFDLKGNKIKNPHNIMGGEEIIETEAEILARLKKGNKKSLSNMRYEKAVKAEEAKAAADEDYIMKVLDPEDFAEGGRAGLYQGGQAEIEPDLSNIGHGSDALMARNMLIAPGSQATTSTGLN
jgi:hypothetical protein